MRIDGLLTTEYIYFDDILGLNYIGLLVFGYKV